MLDAHSIMLLFDLIVQTSVDDRLALISSNFPEAAITTERVVYARDPLKSISDDLDMLKIVPTFPPSNSVQAIAGKFYDRGVLYVFGGATTDAFVMPREDGVFVFIGYKVDRIRNHVSLYVSEDYGTLSEFHPEVVPAAIVHIKPQVTAITSDDIVNLLPYYNFDTHHPGDRMQITIPCIPPGGSVILDRRPFYRNDVPIIDIYKVAGAATVQKVNHVFSNDNTYEDLTNVLPACQHFAHLNGVGIRKNEVRLPIDLPYAPNILYVSSQYGLDVNTGSKTQPLLTLEKAIELYNADSTFDTIFIDEGQYIIQQTLVINRDITIIGHSVDKVDIRMISPKLQLDFRCDNVELRTLLFHNSVHVVASTATLIKFQKNATIFNCVFRSTAGPLHYPYFSVTNLAIYNSILHNADNERNVKLWDVFPSGFVSMQNVVAIGGWDTPFQASAYNFEVSLVDANTVMVDPQRYNYLPVVGGRMLNTGNSYNVGANVDGTGTDIGVYGGRYASMYPLRKYPTNTLVVFRYALPTMYTPVMEKIHSMVLVGDMPSGTQIYGAVSFNGGGTWLKWDINTAAWKEIDLTRLHLVGNTYDELIHRISTYSTIVPKGELVFAWGFTTTNPDLTPIICSVETRYTTKSQSYVPYDRSKFDILINEFAILIKNNTLEQIKDLMIVAY